MHTTDVIIIGAGQAGLAMSRHLTTRAIDHVVLERGRVGERWRTERWDSLRLLTPNWMSRLPNWSYRGPEPEGYMTATEFVSYLRRYADDFDAPVEHDAAVESVRIAGDRYEVISAGGTWHASNVVIATGWADRPAIPSFARHLSPDIHQVAPSSYRNPAVLPDGGVLVVGASATGVQLADELRAAGRDVILAVGRHSRLPRRYRGMDIFWWLERIGKFDESIDEMPDPVKARHAPSLQLVGRPGNPSLDLVTLHEAGVRLTGRVCTADGHRLDVADDVCDMSAAADRKMRRVLAEIDRHVDLTGLNAEVLPAAPIRSLPRLRAVGRIDLRAAGITTVVWATGHRRTYPWISVPVRDEAGEIRQSRGVTPAPGLYVLGQRFQHFRNSNFIDGVGRDAAFVAHHLTTRLARAARP